MTGRRKPRRRAPPSLVVRFLAGLARAGGVMPSCARIAELLGLSCETQVNTQLRRARKAGAIVIEYRGQNIASVTASDGSWRIIAGDRSAPKLVRRCLRCADHFEAPHRLRFLCDVCVAYAERAA